MPLVGEKQVEGAPLIRTKKQTELIQQIIREIKHGGKYMSCKTDSKKFHLLYQKSFA